jgi:hypothetical protein
MIDEPSVELKTREAVEQPRPSEVSEASAAGTGDRQDGKQAGPPAKPPGIWPQMSVAANPASFRPILADRQVRWIQLPGGPPKAHTARVLVTKAGEIRPVPEDRREWRRIPWQLAGTLYEVDTGLHRTSIACDLPAEGDSFAFRAALEIQWWVKHPSAVVQRGIVDVRSVLVPPLLTALRNVSRNHTVRDVAQAEERALRMLDELSPGEPYGLGTRVYLRMATDPQTAGHAAAARDLVHQKALVVHEHDVAKTRQMHEAERLVARVLAYQKILASGDVDRSALHLAEKPGDVEIVMRELRRDLNTSRRQFADLIKHLTTSGAVDRWEINDTVAKALAWLEEEADHVIGRLPSPRDFDEPIDPPTVVEEPPPDTSDQ